MDADSWERGGSLFLFISRIVVEPAKGGDRRGGRDASPERRRERRKGEFRFGLIVLTLL